jgi:putative endonuclease
MTKYRKEIGAWGEGIATDWLAERGYQIVARNVRTPYGEIDVVAQQGDVTIFVEVKTLTSSENFFPEANVTPKKQQRMISVAQFYAGEHKIDHWRIDVISVEGKPGTKPIVTHFENAV